MKKNMQIESAKCSQHISKLKWWKINEKIYLYFYKKPERDGQKRELQNAWTWNAEAIVSKALPNINISPNIRIVGHLDSKPTLGPLPRNCSHPRPQPKLQADAVAPRTFMQMGMQSRRHISGFHSPRTCVAPTTRITIRANIVLRPSAIFFACPSWWSLGRTAVSLKDKRMHAPYSFSGLKCWWCFDKQGGNLMAL